MNGKYLHTICDLNNKCDINMNNINNNCIIINNNCIIYINHINNYLYFQLFIIMYVSKFNFCQRKASADATVPRLIMPQCRLAALAFHYAD